MNQFENVCNNHLWDCAEEIDNGFFLPSKIFKELKSRTRADMSPEKRRQHTKFINSLPFEELEPFTAEGFDRGIEDPLELEIALKAESLPLKALENYITSLK